jgi:hypothetical protein
MNYDLQFYTHTPLNMLLPLYVPRVHVYYPMHSQMAGRQVQQLGGTILLVLRNKVPPCMHATLVRTPTYAIEK